MNKKEAEITEAQLLSLGFRPDMPESGDKCFGWVIHDKHGYNEKEPHTHVVASLESGKCTMWLETYDVDGRTMSLVELPRKLWTYKHVKILLYILSGTK